MNATPDPTTVREIARDCVADYIDDARDIAAHVMGHFGTGVPGNVYAWTNAVRTDLRAAVVSWPDEQPQGEPTAYLVPAHFEQEITRLRALLAEQDGDVRAVAAFLASGKLGPAMVVLHDHFAGRIAALRARDAKAGAER